MALWQKTVAPFSEHKGGVGPCLKIPRSNSDGSLLVFFQSPGNDDDDDDDDVMFADSDDDLETETVQLFSKTSQNSPKPSGSITISKRDYVEKSSCSSGDKNNDDETIEGDDDDTSDSDVDDFAVKMEKSVKKLKQKIRTSEKKKMKDVTLDKRNVKKKGSSDENDINDSDDSDFESVIQKKKDSCEKSVTHDTENSDSSKELSGGESSSDSESDSSEDLNKESEHIQKADVKSKMKSITSNSKQSPQNVDSLGKTTANSKGKEAKRRESSGIKGVHEITVTVDGADKNSSDSETEESSDDEDNVSLGNDDDDENDLENENDTDENSGKSAENNDVDISDDNEEEEEMDLEDEDVEEEGKYSQHSISWTLISQSTLLYQRYWFGHISYFCFHLNFYLILLVSQS